MCPNMNLLKTYKVYPSKLDFKYHKHKFFTYVYLDPFEELPKPLEVTAPVGSSQPITFCFAYEPIYIGKGTGAGYRQNQHLKAFQSNKENNRYKVEAFQQIQKQMAEAAATQDNSKPWNWREYKEQYIKILYAFDDPKQLLRFEMTMIKEIGTRWDGTGTLTNKIKNAYKFDKLSTGTMDPLA